MHRALAHLVLDGEGRLHVAAVPAQDGGEIDHPRQVLRGIHAASLEAKDAELIDAYQDDI